MRSRPATGVDPRDDLHRRIDAFDRYGEVLARQMAALEAGDLDAFGELAGLRDRIAAELDASPAPGSMAGTAAGQIEDGVARLQAQARISLARSTELDRSIRERLGRMRDETIAAIQALDGRQSAARRYQDAGTRVTSLDVRL